MNGARSETAGKLLQDIGHRMVFGAFERPLGTPARWLPGDAPERIESGVGPVLWDWLQGQVPTVVQRIDVARRVEQKVRDFPTPRMEEIVRRVTERELRLIVRLGYGLGAFVGTILVLVDLVL